MSQPSEVFCKNGCFEKLQALGLQLYQKETTTQVLSCEYREFFKNTYLEEHMQSAALMWNGLLTSYLLNILWRNATVLK